MREAFGTLLARGCRNGQTCLAHTARRDHCDQPNRRVGEHGTQGEQLSRAPDQRSERRGQARPWKIRVRLGRLPHGALVGPQRRSASLATRDLHEQPPLFGSDLQRNRQTLGGYSPPFRTNRARVRGLRASILPLTCRKSSSRR